MVNRGSSRSLADGPVRRSGRVRAQTVQIPKLIVRVRFPSPAQTQSAPCTQLASASDFLLRGECMGAGPLTPKSGLSPDRDRLSPRLPPAGPLPYLLGGGPLAIGANSCRGLWQSASALRRQQPSLLPMILKRGVKSMTAHSSPDSNSELRTDIEAA